MRKQIITVALAGGLGLGGAALLGPSIASAADGTTGTASGLADRVSKLKQALAGLVTDGTITQSQADKVAGTLAAQLPDRGPGGPGRGHGLRGGHLSPAATAAALGITVDELRTAEQAGKTLAQIAAAEGISKADLISKLVAAEKTQLAADVKAGRLTQAQADRLSGALTARITDRVDRVRPARGDHGPRPDDATTAPSSSATPSA
jgi:hypothetical protein